MKKIFLTAACAFFMAVPAALAQTNDTIQATIDLDAKYATNMLKPGTKAPEFTLRTYDGRDIKLSQYRGSYVVLDFWASWCPDCRRDIPAMKALYEQFRDYGVQFVGISFDTDREAWAKTYWNRYQMNWTQVSELKKFRKNTFIDKLYKIDWIPSMYLIDPNGKVVMGTVEINKLKAKLESIDLQPKVSKADVLPTFEGGQEAIANYFARNQYHSIQAIRSKVHAEMTVLFNVEIDGSVTGARVVDVKNVQGTSKHFMKLDAAKQKQVLANCVEFYKEQAVRLTNRMVGWKPAMQNDRPIQARVTVPIIFQP